VIFTYNITRDGRRMAGFFQARQIGWVVHQEAVGLVMSSYLGLTSNLAQRLDPVVSQR
jgi:hypothetical protein